MTDELSGFTRTCTIWAVLRFRIRLRCERRQLAQPWQAKASGYLTKGLPKASLHVSHRIHSLVILKIVAMGIVKTVCISHDSGFRTLQVEASTQTPTRKKRQGIRTHKFLVSFVCLSNIASRCNESPQVVEKCSDVLRRTWYCQVRME